MALSASLARPDRHPSLSGTIVYLTGRTVAFSGSDALAFSLSEGASGGQMLGGAFSASCSLTLNDAGGDFTRSASPFGAQVTVRLCEGADSAPLCTFTVSRVVRRDSDPRLTLQGTDALGTAFAGMFQDGLTYPATLLQIARHIASQAGFTLEGSSFPNASFSIPEKPDWGEVSLRQALSFTACAAGCFACIDRSGRLVFRPVNPAAQPISIGPEATLAYEGGERAFGPLSALTVNMKGARRDTDPLTVALPDTVPGPYNTFTVSGNPLFPWQGSHTQALAEALLQALAGCALSALRLTWRGDPAVMLGDKIRITDSRGAAVTTLATGQSLTFQQGFSMQTDCASPAAEPAVGRLFTPSGALNAAQLEGSLNGVIIRDGSIAASSLMAGSITALQLAAGAVTAEKISAGAVTANKIAANAVTAEKISAGAVTADKLAAGSVTAEKLTAAAIDAIYAHLATADIDWADIATLNAVVADIADAQINVADIDWGQVKDLISKRAIITQGEAGELYIARLAVTEANLLSLTVGEILVKGEDGGFYALTVDEEGNVSAERKQVDNEDIQDESIFGDQKLIEGSITARSLNAQEIFGENAIIRQLIAETLDVDALFAREALIDHLNAVDITGNESLRIYVQSQEEMSAYLRVTEDGLEIGRVGDTARFRADNRTMEVTNVKTERIGITQAMGMDEEWAWIATKSGLGLKYVG